MAGNRGERLTWEDPSPDKRGPFRDHESVAKALKSKPGKWAKALSYDKRTTAGSSAQAIRKGIIKAYQPAGSFEAASRTVNGKYWVYVRYVGE